jgi:hypothetical protein
MTTYDIEYRITNRDHPTQQIAARDLNSLANKAMKPFARPSLRYTLRADGPHTLSQGDQLFHVYDSWGYAGAFVAKEHQT